MLPWKFFLKKGPRDVIWCIWGLWQQKNLGQFRQPVSSFFYGKYTIHENPSWKRQCTLFFIFSKHSLTCEVLHWFQGILFINIIWQCLTKNHSMNLSIMLISKWQIVIQQRAFIYEKLSFSFPFWSSQKFKIKGTDSFLMFWVIKVAGASEKSSWRNRRPPALLENKEKIVFLTGYVWLGWVPIKLGKLDGRGWLNNFITRSFIC